MFCYLTYKTLVRCEKISCGFRVHLFNEPMDKTNGQFSSNVKGTYYDDNGASLYKASYHSFGDNIFSHL